MKFHDEASYSFADVRERQQEMYPWVFGEIKCVFDAVLLKINDTELHEIPFKLQNFIIQMIPRDTKGV